MLRKLISRTCLITVIAAGPRADVIELRPVADTTLHSINPANNMGGHTHVAIGVTAKNTAARGLFRFDLGAIPTNAVITSVRFTFTLPAINRPDTAGSSYVVHRMLVPWGEGTKTGNLGLPGIAGEATWNHSAIPTTWSTPGGDFATDASAENILGPAPGEYSIESTPTLVADVQHWLHAPGENYGWLMKVEDETAAQTARQFASRETANGARLQIEYTTVAGAELRFTSIERAGTNVIVHFTGGQGTVAIETAINVDGPWNSLGESTVAFFTNGIAHERAYFRLRID